ncbi:MAG: ABC transporter substrate-binding protein [Xanthobacteraceae bacterium]
MAVFDVPWTKLVTLSLAATLFCAAPGAAQTPIKVSLDGRIAGPAAPFLLPLDKGYYRTEGLDVTVDPAADFLEPITRTASGAYDIAFADLNALIRFREQNPKAPKAVFVVYNRPAYAIIARKSRGIAQPKDLEGKKLGTSTADASSAQWPLFAKLNDIDPSKVTVDNVAVPVREPMLAAGQVDAVAGMSFASYVDLKGRGVPVDDIVTMRMADHGLELYGNAIIVNPKFAADNPDAVRGFLRAFLQGLKDTVREPSQAVRAVLERNETANREVELEQLRMVVRENILTPEVKAQGFGGIDPARFDQAIGQLGLVVKFKTKPALADIFDLSFLPSADARKLHW